VTRGHVVAGIGALALLLVMAMDWYGSVTGDEARRIERITEGASGAEAGEIDRRLNEDARFVAEGEEKNAWQADALVDRILLVLMLGAAALALVTWFTRTLGAKPTAKGLGPGGVAALLATAAAVLVAYRIIQEPGLDQATTVKLGAPLALLPLAMIALGSSWALRADDQATEKEAADAGAA
jgi:hypothetical protein